MFAESRLGSAALDLPSYKDYFQAARTFLERNRCEVLTCAAGLQLGRSVCAEEIGEVRIFLEKHGQFYHPARVEALGSDLAATFVLNVAVTDTGKAWIRNEYGTLRRLNNEFARAYLPGVYACGEVRNERSSRVMAMFLGEWFSGFNEFHLSRDPATGRERVLVWDYGAGDFFLSPEQAAGVYKEAAKILTAYYNLETFEQIFSWHHAAGDFVLKLANARPEVRLITARQYLKLFKHTDGVGKSAALVFKALLIFFLYLSIRMRLDRLDGTGPVVWLGKEALEGAVAGFFEALARKPPLEILPVAVDEGFRIYLRTLSRSDLLELLGNIAATFSPQSPDMPVIRQHLARHAAELRQTILRAAR